MGYVPLPPLNLREEETSGARARLALVVGAIGYGVSYAATVIYLNDLVPYFQKVFDDASAGKTTVAPQPALSGAAATASGISQLAQIALFIVGILFLVWFHRALTNARALGLPARRTPGWGVAGFIIPIVNFWFPYQSGCDLFPPGSPDRKLVGRWWAFWLGAQFTGVTLVFGAFISIGVAAVLTLVAFGLYVMAAVTAREMIERSRQVHHDLAIMAGFVAPTPPGPPPGRSPGYGPPPGDGPPPASPYGPGGVAGPPATPPSRPPTSGPPEPWNPEPPAPPKDPWGNA